jgi:hypothetical protein
LPTADSIPQPDSIFRQEGAQGFSFKIIDDWTEGASALATDNVDVMLTTADVYGPKILHNFKDKGDLASHAFYDGRLVARRRWRHRTSRASTASKTWRARRWRLRLTRRRTSCCGMDLKSSGLEHRTAKRNLLTKAVHTKDGIEPATLFAQQKVDAAVAWDPDMSDAVAKRAGSKKIYDTRIANHLIADILVVSDRFASR